MKRNMMIGLVAVIVVIVLIGAAVMMQMGTLGKKNYSLSLGDFLKYEISVNNTLEKHNSTFEILGINGTNIFYKHTESYGAIDNVNYDNSTKNETPFAFNMDNFPSGHMTSVGKETITTLWGARSTDHYTNSTLGIDVWMLNGAMVKYRVVGDSYTLTEVLIDTNMAQITD